MGQKKVAVSVHYIQSMSAYKAISLKKQQKSKYNLCKHQFRGNLKIKNQSISPKRLVGIESNVSHHVLLNFLDYKPLSELLKNFSCITLERRLRVKKWSLHCAIMYKTWFTVHFMDYKPLSVLLKNFSCITLERRWRVQSHLKPYSEANSVSS